MVDEGQRTVAAGIRDKNGDFDANAPNPVNTHPQCMGDYPKPRPTTSKIPDLSPPVEAATESPALNRPPKPPAAALGPFFQFISTDLKKMLWMGSALIFRHVSFDRPRLEFSSEVRVDHQWEVLYSNIFDLRAYRVNIFIELRSGGNDDRIHWTIDWEDQITNGFFHIAQLNQHWRGGFFSCNGFDAYVPKEVASNLTYANVWNHLLSIHDERPLHLLVWGGDQNYIDFIFEDIPFLRAWVNMQWNEKWTCDFRDDLKEQVEQYHFNTYAENWNCRPEVKRALSSIPSVMMWDDHDIFDGAGSYPPLLHDSPMMMGLYLAAQKMRLLFQHHTTPEKAREHHMVGYQGHNFFARCGPHLLVIGMDGRSERDTKTVQHEKTWDIIFEKLSTELDNVQHLIVLFPVPFSFVRVSMAESVFEHLKNLPNKWRQISPVKQTNSIFGLPELYDDLLDEWTHRAHLEERNRVLRRFQQIAQEKRVRITYFSGDVHCCGVSRFQCSERDRPKPLHDSKLMYQIISSAIVNMPPSEKAVRIAHLFKSKWIPIDQTEEELVDFFQRRPENGKKIFHQKFRPNRNWCYFEECSPPKAMAVTVVQSACCRCLPSRENLIHPVTLGPTSNREGLGGRQPPIHHHSYQQQCQQIIVNDQEQIGNHDLRVRFWLESNEGKHHERQFVSYDLLIPNLK